MKQTGGSDGQKFTVEKVERRIDGLLIISSLGDGGGLVIAIHENKMTVVDFSDMQGSLAACLIYAESWLRAENQRSQNGT